ncbi:MAG: hypothetical protein MJ196_03115 [Treponemataceae bacterium]|nr:hypothetical protein [Treponemataceae bacterium]
MKNMKATDTFRTPPYAHNCAQAVANKYQSLYKSDDIVNEYAPYVGGRAPGGLCGALFAAQQALPQHAAQIEEEFVKACGAATCMQIKMQTGTPCAACVNAADQLVEKYSKL